VTAPVTGEATGATAGVDAAPPGPTRRNPRGTAPLRTLFEAPDAARPRDAGHVRGGLGPELARRYDGELAIPLRLDRPTVVANFVETLDGVVAMDDRGATGGGEVSGFSPTDRFVMGLLRSLADVVLVGAATIRSSGRAAWTPAGVYPDAAVPYAELRERLGLAPAPTTLVATTSGDLDPGLPVFASPGAPVVIAGPAAALDRLRRRRFGAGVELRELRGDGPEAVASLVGVVGDLGGRVLLSEAGPHLFAALASAGLVDELFVTLSPQLAGRAGGTPRLAMVEGAALWPDRSRWARLRSARAAGDHVFLRYQLEESR
jgi:riboflavin biosynthesis pyrimidine reductase